MRMTATIRQAILAQALDAAFGKRENDIKKRNDALGRRIYNAVVTLKERQAIEALKAAKTGGRDWFNHHSDDVKFNVGGRALCYHLTSELPIPSTGGFYNHVGTCNDPALVEATLALCNDEETLKAEREKAEGTLRALLAQHSTTDKLGLAWPEGKKYWLNLENRIIGAPQLPVVRVCELNEMLGLGHC